VAGGRGVALREDNNINVVRGGGMVGP